MARVLVPLAAGFEEIEAVTIIDILRRATSYPGFLDPQSVRGLVLSEEPVVQDGPRLTSRGPGTAMDFALALVENLAGEDRRDAVGTGLQRPAMTGVSNRHTV